MKCEEVGKYKLEFLDGSLPPETRTGVDEHLLSCAPCRDDVADLKAAWDLLDLYDEAAPSEEFMAKTLSAFRRIRRRERIVLRIRRAGLAAAAALLVGFGIFHFAGTPAGDGETAEPVVVEELLENLDLIEDLDFLQDMGDELDLAMEYETYLALGGEESL